MTDSNSRLVAFLTDVERLKLVKQYEAQVSVESRWVRLLDRLMPFIVNLGAQGINWKEQSVTRSQVLRVSEPVREQAPEIYQWIVGRVEESVKAGWLIDA
jgi:putative hydrolase of HD superfamily